MDPDRLLAGYVDVGDSVHLDSGEQNYTGPGSMPRMPVYKCVKKAALRSGPELDSEKLGTFLDMGTLVQVRCTRGCMHARTPDKLPGAVVVLCWIGSVTCMPPRQARTPAAGWSPARVVSRPSCVASRCWKRRSSAAVAQCASTSSRAGCAARES